MTAVINRNMYCIALEGWGHVKCWRGGISWNTEQSQCVGPDPTLHKGTAITCIRLRVTNDHLKKCKEEKLQGERMSLVVPV